MEPFTFQRCQPADEPWLICTLQHQIRGILVLACALSACYLSIFENVDSLSAEHGMVIGGSQRIGNAFLIANAISAVLRLPVNSIAGDAEYSFLLRWWCIVPSREFKSKRWRIVRTGIFIYNKRLVISAHAECGGYCLCRFDRTAETSILSMVIKYKRLVPVFLGPKRPCDVQATLHHTAALVVQA